MAGRRTGDKRSSQGRGGERRGGPNRRPGGSGRGRPGPGAGRGGRGRGGSVGPGWIIGVHAVASLLRETPKRIHAVHVWAGQGQHLISLAKDAGITVRNDQPDEFAGDNHLAQGVAARVAPFPYTDLTALLQRPTAGGGLLIALDSITDTRNLGAILRSAGFFAADGVLMPRDRAAAVTPVTERIARGGAAVVPVAQVTNLSRALAQVADAGWTIVGTALDDVDGELWQEPLDGPICLVLGAEDKGMRRLVRARCDRVVSLTPLAPVQSLNVASFATLAMSEVRRQQRSGGS